MLFLSTPSVGRATCHQKRNLINNKISIHALRGEGDPGRLGQRGLHADFYPRPPWGGRPGYTAPRRTAPHFYPRPPWGGRQDAGHQQRHQALFLSTPSVGRATFWRPRPAATSGHFYPRPPWGGRPILRGLGIRWQRISIHALRGEGDGPISPGDIVAIYISIHALRGEGDMLFQTVVNPLAIFLSTPSVGRATAQPQTALLVIGISIHALRGEGDAEMKAVTSAFDQFLSTPSVGRAT